MIDGPVPWTCQEQDSFSPTRSSEQLYPTDHYENFLSHTKIFSLFFVMCCDVIRRSSHVKIILINKICEPDL